LEASTVALTGWPGAGVWASAVTAVITESIEPIVFMGWKLATGGLLE
jgi:hypothetical protein